MVFHKGIEQNQQYHSRNKTVHFAEQ